jgi:flagellar biosynthetic protein FlhB
LAEDSDAEKKHAPTARRLALAREQGQIRRSNDFPKTALMLLFILGVVAAGGALATLVSTWAAPLIAAAGAGQQQVVRSFAIYFAAALALLLTFSFGLALLTGSMTGGWMMSFVLLSPKLERLSPSTSFSQIFSAANGIEVTKSIIKVATIGGAGLIAFRLLKLDFLSLASPRHLTLADLGGPAALVIAAAVAAATVIAAFDVGIQIWLNRRALRMTDQERREEMRDQEGDPQIRGRRRAMLRRMARARQIEAMKSASALITNPTHFAVAIRYRHGIETVPVVVAKAADLNVTPLIDKAREYGVPMVEAPPLARALHRYADIDQAIPPALYRAVAEVLAYIWRLDLWRAGSGTKPNRPWFPDSIEYAARRIDIGTTSDGQPEAAAQ